MSTPVFVDLESSTQANEPQSTRVSVPLPKDPYEAIRQAYLVGTDTESEPFEAPPTCHVEESEGSGMFAARSMSSDSTALLLPDHPLTHTTSALVLILCRTVRMAVRVLPAMSPGLSAGIAEVANVSDSAFRTRFRSSYDSSSSSTLPLQKRYRRMSELILGTDSEEDEEVEDSSDSDSESEGIEDEGPTAEDEDPAVRDEGLAARVEGPDVDDESYGLDDESHGVDDKIRGLDDEGHSVESDGFNLGEEEAVPEAPPVQTPPSPEWTSGLLPISPSPSVVPLPVSSPMIPLTVPSPMATSITAIPVDEDQFKEVRTAITFRALWRPVLALEAWVGRVDTQVTDMSRAGYDEHRLVHDMLLQQTALQRELQEMRGRVNALEQERDRKER
nr:hypothetical protein [Tanacetum cinerariifolium]